MLTPQHQSEALSRCCVQAVAGRAGLTCSFRDFDYGIDVTVHEVTVRTSPTTGKKRYVESGASLDIQIKSTTKDVLQPRWIVYDLESQAYNDLRDPNVRTPRILVLHAAPKMRKMQLDQTEQRLVIRNGLYWMSIGGRPPTANRHRKRIRIPRRNVFSESALCRIMERIRKGAVL